MIPTCDSPGPLRVHAIDSVAGLLELGPEWRRLQDDAGELPFTSWEWSVTWWRELSRTSMAVRDRLFVRAFRDPRGELVGVAPLLLRSYPGQGPAFRCLRYFGADANITELRGLLCHRDRHHDVCTALLEDVLARDGEWDCFFMDGLRRDLDCPLLHTREDSRWSEEHPDYTISLPKSWEEFRGSRSRNIKESLRKCRNSLQRAGLTPAYRVATRGPELEAGLAAFFELHAARAGGTERVPHKDVFEDPDAKRFLRALVRELGEVDGVRIFTMELAGRPVAVRVAFCVGRSLYLYYSGYDPAYGRYSVMTSVVAEAIKYAIAQGYQTVNLSPGKDISKTRWSPDETLYRDAMLPSTAGRSRLITEAYLRLRRRWLSHRMLPGARRQRSADRALERPVLG